MRTLVLILTIILSIPLASAQFQVTHPSLNMTDYPATLTQFPGTSSTYSVDVFNTGDVRFDKVYLTLSFLPSSWYEIGDSKPLEIGETQKFTFILKLPNDASGTIDLDLTAHGTRGFGEVASTSVKVKLIAENPQPSETTSTTAQIITYQEKDFFSQNANYIAIILVILILLALVILFKS